MIYYLSVILMSVLLSGCHHEDEAEPQTPSSLVFRVSANPAPNDATDLDEPVIFTGNDVLWFNETTNEIRFKNNMSEKQKITSSPYHRILFYIGGEYLFSAQIIVSDIHSRIYSSLVFFYDPIENRFYIQDGYPKMSDYYNDPDEQKIRDENMKKIGNEWNKFINQLKQEDRCKK